MSLSAHAETQAWTLEMKAALGQKAEMSLLDLQLGTMDSHVFKHEGRTDGQGAFGGGDCTGGG